MVAPNYRPVDIVGIGAQKCGSTWLYDILSDHPQVGVSRAKEVDYFSYYWDRGSQWYSQYFSGSGKLLCEVSPSYFHCADAPWRVVKHNPEAKVIALLRDPVKRAYSNHVHDIRHGFLRGADLSFEFGLENNSAYVEQGLYFKHLSRWLDSVPEANLLILLQEDIQADPAAVASRVYRHIGIDSLHEPAALSKRSNERQAVVNVDMAKKVDGLREKIQSGPLAPLWTLAKGLGLKRVYHSINVRPPQQLIPPMAADTEDRLRAEFANDIVKLEALLGRSLAQWQREKG
ncbi:sulfotransferase domain-containing protein [Nitrogeniibacter aestuarii]|uniref:sulfotransferase domain-containing protein n=1 Tax=Nitrogeniibacter aestuarii TaxID=2815343 RepID=UPI001D10B2FB|nr:sulfotransferase domain-containing protein [Nitrogeniibacter aestuarii]